MTRYTETIEETRMRMLDSELSDLQSRRSLIEHAIQDLDEAADGRDRDLRPIIKTLRERVELLSKAIHEVVSELEELGGNV